eukprot:6077500-Prymnesium_polylepis.1
MLREVIRQAGEHGILVVLACEGGRTAATPQRAMPLGAPTPHSPPPREASRHLRGSIAPPRPAESDSRARRNAAATPPSQVEAT